MFINDSNFWSNRVLVLERIKKILIFHIGICEIVGVKLLVEKLGCFL